MLTFSKFKLQKPAIVLYRRASKPVAVYFKMASNFIIALHVINGVKETEPKGKAEDLNFDPLLEFLP